MRIITEKDRTGIAKALQVFMSHVDGQKRIPFKTLQEAADRAIDEGLSFDQLLNKENYSRAGTVTANPSVTEYVDILVNRQVQVRDLTEDEGWDEQDNFGMIAEAFHTFYKEINPKGGTWNTPNAKLKLCKAIKRHSLQAILSEKLILEITESLSARDETGELTCFNYIDNIIHSAENYQVDDSPTQQQLLREKERTAILRTEGADPDSDGSIFYDENEDTNEMDFNPNDEDEGISFIAYKDPREYKRTCISQIIFSLSFDELNGLKDCIADECYKLEDLVSALTDGKIDKDKEEGFARTAHQFLNSELLASFVSCVRLQGVDINDESACEYDILQTNWDMRDSKTRKLQKIKQLIYDYGDKDEDLLSAIRELEELYKL